MDDLADWVNHEILNLWRNKFKEDKSALMPLIYSEIKTSVLLFVSLNPSFTTRGFKKLLENSPYSTEDVKDALNNWQTSKSLPIVKEFEKLSKANGSFFNKFREIAKCANIDWEHIDLFFNRRTHQKEFLPYIYKNNDLVELTKIGQCQLELSKNLICEINPITIVVANATASKIFKKEFDATFNDNLGHHEIELNNQKIPVFLCSMLTGQRAMDNYSVIYLQWQIKQAIGRRRKAI
jgi:hypothetical protein